MTHRDAAALEAGLDHIRQSPSDHGVVELIVRRPAVDEREELAQASLDVTVGLVGDNWRVKGSTSTADGSANPDAQITVMNSRAALLVATTEDRRKLAGDQIYADLNLGQANLPPGTRLAIGSAVIEVSAKPHLGCEKFGARFGEAAWRFVNSRVGRDLRLRGLNARVVTGGSVRVGDEIRKLPARPEAADILPLMTDRLVIRPFTEADLDAMHAVWSDPEVMDPVPSTVLGRDESRAKLAEKIGHQDKHGFSRWAVVDKASGAVIGECGLEYLDGGPDIELGYKLARGFWGRGLALEAARACLEWALTARSEQVVAIVDAGNARSARVLAPLGMVRAGTARHFGRDWDLYRAAR